MSGQAHKPGKQTGAARRMRRLRGRRRVGNLCFHGDAPREIIDALVKKGWLKANEATDPNRLAEALVDVAACWACGTLAAET